MMAPPQPSRREKNLWIITAMVSLIALLVIVAFIGFMATIALPRFFRTQAKIKQAEAKTKLEALFTAQYAYFSQYKAYAQSAGGGQSCFDKLGWKPAEPTIYNYYCGDDIFPCTKPGCDPCFGVLSLSKVKSGSFTLMAAGNIDRDSACDIWTINDVGQLRIMVSDLDN
jgi:type IV pilus assembly protein PilA